MIDAGMNVARINFDTKNVEYHKETLRNLRLAIRSKTGRKCSVIIDLQGLEIELKKSIAFEKISLKAGQTFDIVSD